jgi:hypothetical protein
VTPQPDAEPDRLTVAENQPIDVATLNQSRSVTIGGSGVLQAAPRYENERTPVELWLTVVQVEPQAQVVAKELVVQASLHLQSGASLMAAPFDKITLVPEVELEFRCGKAEDLPHLDLGEIGENYSVLPSLLKVVIDSSSSSDEIHKPLIQGKTLSNCAEWQKKVTGFPSEYETKCETISGPGQSLLADGPVIGLFLATGNSKDDLGLSGGAIAGIVIGVLAVVGVAAEAVWFFVLRKRDDSGGGASA